MLPILKNWVLIPTTTPGSYCLTGQVLGSKRFKDLEAIRTSTLTFIDFKNGMARTLNTEYSLSTPANGTVPLGHDFAEDKRDTKLQTDGSLNRP